MHINANQCGQVQFCLTVSKIVLTSENQPNTAILGSKLCKTELNSLRTQASVEAVKLCIY